MKLRSLPRSTSQTPGLRRKPAAMRETSLLPAIPTPPCRRRSVPISRSRRAAVSRPGPKRRRLPVRSRNRRPGAAGFPQGGEAGGAVGERLHAAGERLRVGWEQGQCRAEAPRLVDRHPLVHPLGPCFGGDALQQRPFRTAGRHRHRPLAQGGVGGPGQGDGKGGDGQVQDVAVHSNQKLPLSPCGGMGISSAGSAGKEAAIRFSANPAAASSLFAHRGCRS